MMGLALGVDYSLLIVSRFREELAAAAIRRAAALRTRETAGRTTVFAGVDPLRRALPLRLPPARLAALLAGDGAGRRHRDQRRSIAWVALPGLLALLGARINAGGSAPRRSGRRAPASRRPPPRAALRRPAPRGRPDRDSAGCCLPRPPSPSAPAPRESTSSPRPTPPAGAPKRSTARSAPAGRRPSSSSPAARRPDHHAAAAGAARRWQRRIAVRARGARRDRPGRDRPRRRSAARTGADRSPPGANAAPQGWRGSAPVCATPRAAVGRLRGGIAQAAQGSGLLGEGAGRARQGAGLLAGGLATAAGGGARAGAALTALQSGTKRLAAGQRKASAAGFTLALGLRSLLPTVRGDGLARARRLARELEEPPPAGIPRCNRRRRRPPSSCARSNPRTKNSTACAASPTASTAASNASPPAGSGSKAARGGSSGAASGLVGGLRRLGGGAQRLEGGLGELEGGAGALQQRPGQRLSALPPAAGGPAPRRRAGLGDRRAAGRRRAPAAPQLAPSL